MLLKATTGVMVLVLLIQQIEGYKRVIEINESYDDENDFTIRSGATDNADACCIYGNCSCCSFCHALANLTDNTVINITTDVELSSIISLTGLDNILLTGHDNPTINCNSHGGLYLMSCNNFTARGILWRGCGAVSNSGNQNSFPVLQMHNSSNINIKNCSFQQSIGQTVVLSGMSGIVNISYCNFLANKQYNFHGMAIHYTSKSLHHHIFNLTINNCKFFYNKGAKSIIYLGQSTSRQLEVMNLQDSNFYHNKGTPIYLSNQTLLIDGNNEFFENMAENGGGIHISDNSTVVFKENAVVYFTNNKANYGGAIYLANYSNILFEGCSTFHQHHENPKLKFHNNTADSSGGAVYSLSSNVTFNKCVEVVFIDNISVEGGAMTIHNQSSVTFGGHSTVKFANNSASIGGTILASTYSIITFDGNTDAAFINNDANYGGAVYIKNNSNVNFQGNCSVSFTSNNGVYGGGAMVINHFSTATLKENSTTTYKGNNADCGGAVIISLSTMIFKGNSTSVFNDNRANYNRDGGALYSNPILRSVTTFHKSSKIIRNNNNNNGIHYSTLVFEESSMVTFNNNHAGYGAGVYTQYCNVIVEGNSSLSFNANKANNGGAIIFNNYTTATFGGNSTAEFNDNKADTNCGAMYVANRCTVTFMGSFVATFNSNKAGNLGGALKVFNSTFVTFKENSKVIFDNNNADNAGGAIRIEYYCSIAFTGNSMVSFNNNRALNNGGAMYIGKFSTLIVESNSVVSAVYNGGTVYTNTRDNATVAFTHNKAQNGGAIYSHNSDIVIKGNSVVTFNNNEAIQSGGVTYSENSTLVFIDYVNISFFSNRAKDGGVINLYRNASIKFRGKSNVTFLNNTAEQGGVVYTAQSAVEFAENSSVSFTSNAAFKDGGAMYLTDDSSLASNVTSISFFNNTAIYYGSGIYVQMKVQLVFLNSDILFQNNNAGTNQKSVFINVPESCDDVCFFKGVEKLNPNISLPVATSIRKLKIYNSAKCISGNGTDCDTYFMNNIMLGQDITFDACVLDYYNQSIEAKQFSITGMDHPNLNITGTRYISISCNHTIQGLSVIGNFQATTSYNYTIVISSHAGDISRSGAKTVSIKLIVELSQCHHGFWYSNKSQKCECYDFQNIISCSDNSSTIKRGYWFGSVNSKSTVTSCPNDYCNFTCCEITSGIYHLSPVRANQCKPHRSGTACGNCEKGYSLSFDSNDCVEVNKCTTGQTVLVITLSLLYWIAVVVAVFVMMYFKVTVGSLYAIIYYYSVLDILLSRVLFISNGLYTTVNIMSSLAKLTPQFLGQLCLVQNMSGIDQQFIHYVHPTVISLILIMIVMLARRSHRVSSFVSRGIIHFICFLLLLSYTSVATTSLLLLRPLIFLDIDGIYTYLSPDIEYFNGRHLAYVIVAATFTTVIVIGFPLLLLFEPLLNSKINFIKIKPLLDQFQHCYKDKYRCFAGYYMIYRLLIILLVNVRVFDEFATQIILISTCAVMELIHVLVRPYVNSIHNILDGMILQSIVIVSVLPILEYVNKNDKTLVVAIAYFLVIWPLTTYIAIKFWTNRKNFFDTFKYVSQTCSKKYSKLTTDNVKQQKAEVLLTIIVDDAMRRNATVVDV